jgi:uncharacterized protein YndB with AHSA1/START domain
MAEPPAPGDSAGEGISITRIFAVSRERVWREWTEPARFADWFGGDHGDVPVSTVSMDVRVGGQWRATMLVGTKEIRWKGEYQEVDEPRRLVFTISDQPGDKEYELVIVDLADLGDGRTEMAFQQRGRMSPEQYKAAGHGWSTFFDRLEEHLLGTA